MDDAKLVGLIVPMILKRPSCLHCISVKISATKIVAEPTSFRLGVGRPSSTGAIWH